eukprot:scpid75424/ scgid11876/ 
MATMDILVDPVTVDPFVAGSAQGHAVNVRQMWLWLFRLSAALFIGDEGDIRVGSGVHPRQMLTMRCKTVGTVLCTLHARPFGGDKAPVFLGMDYNGSLETVIANKLNPEATLQRLRNKSNTHQFVDTYFKVVDITKRAGCKRTCHGLQSSKTGHFLHITGSRFESHRNLTKLHIVAQGKRSKMNGPCMKNPGPYVQHRGSDQPTPFVVYHASDFGDGRQAKFDSTTCQFGRLKASYPVGVSD